MDTRSRFSLQKRLTVFEGAIWCLLGAILVRYGWIQVVRGSELKQEAMEQAIKIHAMPAPRGLVLDRNGNKLIENKYVLNLVIEQEDLPDVPKDAPQSNRQRNALQQVTALAPMLQLEPDELVRKILAARQEGRNRFLLLRDNLNEEELAEAERIRARFPFLSIKSAPRRVYPGEELAGHVLGYVGEVSKENLATLREKGYRQGDIIGLAGFEASYDDKLRGEDGVRELVTAFLGREVAPLGEVPPKPGETVYLTLDAGMQSILQDAYGEENGAAVVIDLRDGGILAMYSSGSFDPNAFMDRRNPLKIDYLLDSDGRNRLYPRAIRGTYPPGSTFKLLTALAALEHKVITPQTHFTCTGTKTFYGNPHRCTHVHGSIDLLTAITVSCNIYFFEVGTRLDIDQLFATAKKYGLAERTGIDLPDERANLIPSRAWKESRYSDPAQKKWFPGDTISVAVGQGMVDLTPLGLARFYSTVALKGKILSPHLLYGFRDEQTQKFREHPAKPFRDVGMDPKTWELLDLGLSQVVKYGTARGISMPNLEICGKTGTAQVAKLTTVEAYRASAKRLKDHAWFAGYAPRENPQIAWGIIVENAGFGASAAAPIAKRLCNYWFFNRSDDHAPPPVSRPPSTISSNSSTSAVNRGAEEDKR
jgi:penicillin-binding protein 2